jgi:hypothetical protein
MSHAPPAEHSDRFAGLLLLVLVATTLILQPGHVASATVPVCRHLIVLFALFLASWKTHGVAYSLIACTILFISDRYSNEQDIDGFWQITQMIFLAILGMNLIVWSVLPRTRVRSVFWLIAAVGLIALSMCLWALAARSAGAAGPVSMSNKRMQICCFVLLLFGGLGLVALLKKKMAAAWLWLAVSVIAPAAGYGLARAWGPVEGGPIVSDAHWDRVGADLAAWSTNATASSEAWCWTTPWLVFGLILIGAARTIGRGFRQRRQGNAPLAWLIFVAAILLATSLLSAATPGAQPFALLWLGIALSVFAVADLVLLLYEQLVLPTPDTGPSNVPRV